MAMERKKDNHNKKHISMGLKNYGCSENGGKNGKKVVVRNNFFIQNNRCYFLWRGRGVKGNFLKLNK